MNKYKIMIVDDEPDILELLEKSLAIEGFQNITKVDNGLSAVSSCRTLQPDMIILDVMLPGIDGYEVCKQIREFSHCPILFLSSKNDELDKILGLAVGGDDYVTKPFNNNELLARIKVHLRKKNNVGQSRNLTFKDIELNLDDYTIKCNGKDIVLPKIEFEILRTLMERPNHVHTKNNLIESVWDNEDSADDNTLNVHISKIRNRLNKANPDEEYIETVWKIGYKMKN